ncbi:MAG: hypothetical protein WDM91_10980 [Rhizomicrobium sp.]
MREGFTTNNGDSPQQTSDCFTTVKKCGARAMANAAKRLGLITPQPCADCGSEKSEMHHPDYDRPLDVVWLCKDCHAQHHRGDPPTGQSTCSCGRPNRVGQRNCHRCHALANQLYRIRRRNELEELRAAKWREYFASKTITETPSIDGVSGPSIQTSENKEAGAA